MFSVSITVYKTLCQHLLGFHLPKTFLVTSVAMFSCFPRHLYIRLYKSAINKR